MNQIKNFHYNTIISLIVIIILYILTSTYTDFNLSKSLVSFPKAFIWMFNNFIPDTSSLVKLPKILNKTFETVLLSIAATMTSSLLAFILSFLGSSKLSKNYFLCGITRIIASIFRNIPNAVWSMVLLLSFGQNILTGFFALFFVSFGMLTRAFIEIIDGIKLDTVEALKSTGSRTVHIFFIGVLPIIIGPIISWILYMIETNVRSSTLIGMLTGTGIGLLFNIYYKSMQYNIAGLIVVVITITILFIEALSNFIRRRVA